MIVGADKRVSSAFRATLREEPSSVDLAAAFTRKERGEKAILTVSGLTHAIARAEEHMRERVRVQRASQPDIFDTLVTTDDAVGPAVYRPYIPTPIPPDFMTSAAPEDTLVMAIPAMHAPVIAPVTAPTPAPILVLDPQAFYHPAGPIPGFGPRRSSRGALAWAAIACAPLAALLLLVTVIAVSRPWNASTVVAPARIAPAVVVEEPTPLVIAAPPALEEPTMPVVDVKTLKAPKPRPRH